MRGQAAGGRPASQDHQSGSAWPRPGPPSDPHQGFPSFIRSFPTLASSKPAGPCPVRSWALGPRHPLGSRLSPSRSQTLRRGLLQSVLLTLHPGVLGGRPHCHPYFAVGETEALGRKAGGRTGIRAVICWLAMCIFPAVRGSCCPTCRGPSPSPRGKGVLSWTSQKAEACRQLTVPGLRP